ncbi:hypothetical protein GCM10027184_05850 [Saccharothrix stipae]
MSVNNEMGAEHRLSLAIAMEHLDAPQARGSPRRAITPDGRPDFGPNFGREVGAGGATEPHGSHRPDQWSTHPRG